MLSVSSRERKKERDTTGHGKMSVPRPPAVFDEFTNEWKEFKNEFEFEHDEILRLMSTTPWSLDDNTVYVMMSEAFLEWEEHSGREMVEQWLCALLRSNLYIVSPPLIGKLLTLTLALARVTRERNEGKCFVYRLARALAVNIEEMLCDVVEDNEETATGKRKRE